MKFISVYTKYFILSFDLKIWTKINLQMLKEVIQRQHSMSYELPTIRRRRPSRASRPPPTACRKMEARTGEKRSGRMKISDRKWNDLFKRRSLPRSTIRPKSSRSWTRFSSISKRDPHLKVPILSLSNGFIPISWEEFSTKTFKALK